MELFTKTTNAIPSGIRWMSFTRTVCFGKYILKATMERNIGITNTLARTIEASGEDRLSARALQFLPEDFAQLFQSDTFLGVSRQFTNNYLSAKIK